MIYAPVLIITVNRYQHFKKCIESLSRCTSADKTDVFVAVDYPPSDKYWEGYYQIKAYLDNCNGLGFKSLNIIYRETNYFYTKEGNMGSLIKQVCETYDRYITTEDDNEFSPNFLEYMNRGLEQFEDDKKVIAICGCKDTAWYHKDNENIVKVKLFAAYGVGRWKNKMKEHDLLCSSFLLSPKSWTLTNFCKLLFRNQTLFSMYVLGILCKDNGFFWKKDGSLSLCDSAISIYMHLSDKVCIAPTLSKSTKKETYI